MLECVFMMSDAVNDVLVFLRLVGQRVSSAREARGLSLAQLARLAVLPVETLLALERGQCGIEVDELHRLADALSVALTDLLPVEAEVRDLAEVLRGDAQTQLGPAGDTPAGPGMPGSN